MVKLFLIIIGSILVVILLVFIYLVFDVIVSQKTRDLVSNEDEYVAHCQNHAMLLIPNPEIRMQVTGKRYVYEYQDFEVDYSFVNLETIDTTDILNSITVLAKTKSFRAITFYQAFEGRKDYHGYKYPKVEAKDIFNFDSNASDAAFLSWLKSHKPILVDQYELQEADLFEATAVYVPVKNFGINVLDDLPAYKLQDLRLGQGEINFTDFKSSIEKFSNLKTLSTNNIYINEVNDKVLEEYLIEFSNRKQLTELNLHIGNLLDIDNMRLKAATTRIKYETF